MCLKTGKTGLSKSPSPRTDSGFSHAPKPGIFRRWRVPSGQTLHKQSHPGSKIHSLPAAPVPDSLDRRPGPASVPFLPDPGFHPRSFTGSRKCRSFGTGNQHFFLPSQDFADSPPEGGWRYLSAFEWDGQYQPVNVLLSRACVIACGVSTPAVVYTLENRGASPAPSAAPRFWSLPPKESRPRPLFALPMKAVRSMWKAIPYTSAATVHFLPCPRPPRSCTIAVTRRIGGPPADAGPVLPFNGRWSLGKTRQLEPVFSTQPGQESGQAIVQASLEHW